MKHQEKAWTLTYRHHSQSHNIDLFWSFSLSWCKSYIVHTVCSQRLTQRTVVKITKDKLGSIWADRFKSVCDIRNQLCCSRCVGWGMNGKKCKKQLLKLTGQVMGWRETDSSSTSRVHNFSSTMMVLQYLWLIKRHTGHSVYRLVIV